MILGFALQFTMPFAALPIAAESILYRVQFYRKGYSGSVTELKAGKTPWKEEIPEELTGVKPKRISIEPVCETVDLNGFYTEGDRDMLVVLERFEASVWTKKTVGWLNPYDATEPYQEAPYVITLSATCGLGSLTDFPFAQYPSTLSYPGELSIHDLLYGCLVWTGYDLPLRSWTGRYEESTLSGGLIPAGPPDPLKTTFVNPRLFLKNDGTYESGKAVLDNLCDSYGAVLVQHNAIWHFLSNDARTEPQSWHEYTGPLASTPVVTTTNLELLAGANEDLRWIRGAEVGIMPQKKRLKLSYSYGEPVNLLLNGDFTSGLANWTVNQNAGQLVEMNGDGSEDNPFRVKVNGQTAIVNSTINALPNLEQTVSITRGTFAVGSVTRNGLVRMETEAHILSISGLFVNLVTTGAILYVVVVADGKTYFLTKEGGWVSNQLAGTYLAFDNYWSVNGSIEARPSKGERFELTTPPVPGTGNYTVKVALYAGGRIQPAPATGLRSITYRDVRLSVTNGSAIPLKGEQWTVQVGSDPKERKRTTELSLVMGDQLSASQSSPQSIRYGALLRTNRTPTARWVMNGRLDRFQKLTARSALAWLAPKLRRMRGDVILINPAKQEPGPLATIGVADCTPPFSGVIIGWSWTPHMRQCGVTLHAQPPSLITETYKGSYETPDGVLVPIVEPVDVSAPVPVPTNPTPRQNTVGGSGSGAGLAGLVRRLVQRAFIVYATPKPPPP